MYVCIYIYMCSALAHKLYICPILMNKVAINNYNLDGIDSHCILYEQNQKILFCLIDF